ncbi:tudor and KH domain-containing protein-like [Sycon ciliatum]|uniref:tudor and KH domain-containing protein-like n=1 Tax=Sycon ciliatum TaxID=27933 RepID=UPI0031F65D0D
MSNSGVVPKLLLVAAPVTALLLYWMWRRRQHGSSSNTSQSANGTRGARAAMSNSRQRITVEVEVPDFAVGFVIGRGGQNIRKIETETGARIKMRDDPDKSGSKTEINGFPDQVASAEGQVRQAITDKIRKVEESQKKSCTVEIVLPQHAIGRVIGRRGETIRNIERVSKARVRVERSTQVPGEDRLCIIAGTDEQVTAAANMVRDEIAQDAIDHKAQPRGPSRQLAKTSSDLPTSDFSQHGLDPVDVDWASLAARVSPSADNSANVFVSAASHPHCFWAQVISEAAKDLERLTEEMTAFYSGLRDNQFLLNKVRVGDVCASTYANDGTWYRGRIMDISGDQLDIFFLDYGDSQYTTHAKLKALKPEFLTVPFQAVVCCLEDVAPLDGSSEWPGAACDDFQRLAAVSEWKPLVMQYDTLAQHANPAALHPEPLVVRLIDTSSKESEDVHVGRSLVAAGLAAPCGSAVTGGCSSTGSNTADSAHAMDAIGEEDDNAFSLDGSSTQGQSSAASFSPSGELSTGRQECAVGVDGQTAHHLVTVLDGANHASLPNAAFGSLIQVRVTAVRDPNYFWVQLGAKLDSIEQMNDELTEFYSELSSDSMHLTDVKPAKVCCTMFGHDETWHRAVITKVVDSEYVTVQYLDYGDTCNVRVDNLKELREDFLTMPFQAIPCQMANIVPFVERTWCREAVDRFEQLTHAGSWQCNLLNLVLPSSSGSLPQVELFDMVAEGVSVSEKMVEDRLAVWSSLTPKQKNVSRSSLSAEPALLVQKALSDAEEEDIQKYVDKLPVLASSTQTGLVGSHHRRRTNGSRTSASSNGVKLAATFSAKQA